MTEFGREYGDGLYALCAEEHLEADVLKELNTLKEIFRENPDFGRVVCRCEVVTEAEIRDAIRRPVGAKSIDGVKRRVRAGMGRCQGGFCSPRVMEILCEELGVSPLSITKSGGNSQILAGTLYDIAKEARS